MISSALLRWLTFERVTSYMDITSQKVECIPPAPLVMFKSGDSCIPLVSQNFVEAKLHRMVTKTVLSSTSVGQVNA